MSRLAKKKSFVLEVFSQTHISWYTKLPFGPFFAMFMPNSLCIHGIVRSINWMMCRCWTERSRMQFYSLYVHKYILFGQTHRRPKSGIFGQWMRESGRQLVSLHFLKGRYQQLTLCAHPGCRIAIGYVIGIRGLHLQKNASFKLPVKSHFCKIGQSTSPFTCWLMATRRREVGSAGSQKFEKLHIWNFLQYKGIPLLIHAELYRKSQITGHRSTSTSKFIFKRAHVSHVSNYCSYALCTLW